MTIYPAVWFRPLAGLVLSLFGGGGLRAATPSLAPVAAPVLWTSAEFRLAGGPEARNAFDPEELALDATFTGPTGVRSVVPLFWFQDYHRALVSGKEVLTATGAPGWRVRFTPTVAGEYRVAVTALRAGAAPVTLTESRFTVADRPGPKARGWVTLGADRRTLATSDGRTLWLSGENVCWPQARGTVDYDEWFDALQRSGMNVARLWMAPWWAPLEHVPGTLNHYRLDAAWQLDHIFRAAEQRGIYLVFCFDHHGMFQVDSQNWSGGNNFWNRNPYSSTVGGPCSSPNDFFVNPQAKRIYEKRLRYLIGRYGSSPQLLAWEFFNEIDNVYPHLRGEDVGAWHREMGRWLHAHDPFHHLVTTSLTGGSDRPEMWQIPELDFATYHSYADAAPARFLAELSRHDVQRYGKPMWIGEFGTSAQAWEIEGDPHLRGFRQGLWGGAVGGSVGTAAPWWWEDIHAANAYGAWTHLNAILHTAGLADGTWAPAEFIGPAPRPADIGAVVASAEAFRARLPVGGRYGGGGDNVAVVVDPLSASRTAEHLNHYLHAPGTHADAKPMRLKASFAAAASLVVHVNSVSGRGELVVRVDGREVGRTPLPDKDGKSRAANEYNADFSYGVPAGPHEIAIENAGNDWVFIDYLELSGVQPATMPGGWRYRPEPIGLRQSDRAVVYVVSPWTVWPAGAALESPPKVVDESITLPQWPAGDFEVQWFDPATGRRLQSAPVKSNGGALVLPLPEFNDDLAATVMPLRR